MPPLQQDKDSIISIVKAYESSYKSIEIDVLAAAKENSLYGLYMVARLSHEEKPEEESVMLTIDDKIVIFRRIEKFDIKRFRNLVERIGGVLEICNKQIMLNELPSSSIIRHEKPGWSLGKIFDKQNWPAYTLSVNGRPIQSVVNINELTDLMNNRGQILFTSLEQLTDNQLGIQLSSTTSVSVVVVAPVYCKLENLGLTSDAHLSGSFRIHKAFDHSSARLRVVYETADGAHAGSYSRDFADEGSEDGVFLVYKIKDSANKDKVNAARIFFSMGDWKSKDYINVSGNTATPVSPKDTLLPVLKMFHGGKEMENFLIGTTGRDSEHEAATSWLLSILGFKTFLMSNKAKSIELIFDENKVSRGSTDVLVCDPDSNRCIIVDATIGVPDSKIDAIRSTSEYIKEKTGIQVIPVILSRASSRTAKKLTEDDVVRIVDVDDVRGILNLLSEGKNDEAKQLFLSLLNKPLSTVDPY